MAFTGQGKPPAGAAVINRSHPLARGLRVYWLFNEMGGHLAVDLVGGYSGSMGSTGAWIPGGIETDGASTSAIGHPYLLNLATVSVATRMALTTVTAGKAICGFADGLGSGVNDKLLAVDTLSAGTRVNWYVYDGAAKQAYDSTHVPTAGQTYDFVGTADGTNAILYRDGGNAQSLAAGNTYTGYTVPNVFYGVTTTSRGQAVTTAEYFGVWDRALGNSEVAWLHAEPYAFLARPRRRTYFLPYTDDLSTAWDNETITAVAKVHGSGGSPTTKIIKVSVVNNAAYNIAVTASDVAGNATTGSVDAGTSADVFKSVQSEIQDVSINMRYVP